MIVLLLLGLMWSVLFIVGLFVLLWLKIKFFDVVGV